MSALVYVLVLTAIFGAVFSVGCLVERAPAALRLFRRRRANRRLRELRKVSAAPDAGVIVRPRQFFTPHWNAAVGRAYRALAADRARAG